MTFEAPLAGTRGVGAPLTLERLALNLVTVGFDTPLEASLDACVYHGIPAVALWTQNYRGMGAGTAARLARERGLVVTGLCRMSGFGEAVDESDWRDAVAEAHRLIDEAVEIGAHSITVIGGGCAARASTIAQARQRIANGVGAVLSHAREVVSGRLSTFFRRDEG